MKMHWLRLLPLVSVVGACTAQQLAEDAASARACAERPGVRACQTLRLADCVTMGTCETREAVAAYFACYELCRAEK